MVLSTLRRTFHKYPLMANVATYFTLISTADTACQIIENKGIAKFNWERLKNMGIMGAMYYGPVMFFYYRLLDRKLPGKNPRTIAVKMFIDQVIVMVPSLGVFFIGMGILERKPWEKTKQEMQHKFLPTYVTSCLFWPAAQVVNFAVIPPMFRVAYVSGASLIWLIILSYIKNRPKLPYVLQKIAELTTPSSPVSAQEVEDKEIVDDEDEKKD